MLFQIFKLLKELTFSLGMSICENAMHYRKLEQEYLMQSK